MTKAEHIMEKYSSSATMLARAIAKRFGLLKEIPVGKNIEFLPEGRNTNNTYELSMVLEVIFLQILNFNDNRNF